MSLSTENPIVTPPEDETPEMAEARTQIEETRAHMSETIDAIKEQLSPATLMAEAKESVMATAADAAHELKTATVDKAQEVVGNVIDRAKDAASNAMDIVHNAADYVAEKAAPVVDSAKQQLTPAMDAAKTVVEHSRQLAPAVKGAGETIVDTIKMNPIPAALIAIGIGWLLAAPRKAAYPSYDTRADSESDLLKDPSIYPDSDHSNKLSRTWDNVGDSMSHMAANAKEMASSAKDKVTDIASKAGQQASGLASTAKDQAATVATVAKDKTQQTVSFLDEWVHDEPIAAGAIALLVGAAVGLALPSSSQENRWLGPTRDQLALKAAETAQEVAGKVQDAAQNALGSAKEAIAAAA